MLLAFNSFSRTILKTVLNLSNTSDYPITNDWGWWSVYPKHPLITHVTDLWRVYILFGLAQDCLLVSNPEDANSEWSILGQCPQGATARAKESQLVMIGWRWSSRWIADISGLALSSSLLIQSCAHSLLVKFSSNHCTQPTNLMHNCGSFQISFLYFATWIYSDLWQ